MIKCPCNKCCLGKWLDVGNGHGDILCHGFLLRYTEWIVHGEHTIYLPPSQSTIVNVDETFFGQDDIRGLVRDAFGINSLPSDNTQLGDTTIEVDTEESTENDYHSDEGVSYKRLLEECAKELYAGCKWLEPNHSCRFQKERFDGTIENRGPPTPLTGSDVLKQLSGIRFKYGKSKKRTREEDVSSTSTHAKEATHDEGAFECTNTIIEEDIVEGYIKEECLNFCSRYFEGVETPFNHPLRNDENVVGKEMYMFNSSGHKLGKVEILDLDGKSLAQAHRYVLLNLSKIQPFRDVFLTEKQALRDRPMDSKTIEKLMVDEFPWWLKNQVSLLQEENVDEEVLSLAIGPNIAAKQYNGFITNGYRFLIRRHEEFKNTQNSGVMVEVEGGYYYGKLTNIIELEYFRGYKIVLFQCDWVDNRLYRGLKKDKYGFPLVNFSRPLSVGSKKSTTAVAAAGTVTSTATISKMFKSKTTMQNHKRKQSEMNPPTSHNFQTQSKSFSTDMQTTRQVIKNTNHPSSALKAYFGPSSHMQTTRQVINNTNYLSSSFQPAIRPSFLYDMRQNSLSSFSLQASVRPDVHQNSSSSSSSSRSQSLQSQPTLHEPTLHQSSSLNSLLNQDHDLLSEVEINLADQYKQNLLSEVEKIDVNGNILRTQKMTAKQVYKLKGVKRFMTLILKQPNICPPDAKDWKECKESYAAMLIAELRRRFCIPQGESVDKVRSAMFSMKRRTVKYRLKQGLYQQAANKLNEANGINGLDAQQKNYTDDKLLAALDLLKPPENFLEHQWRVYKSHLRKPIAKVIANREISSKNKKVESYKKQVETQGLQIKNMDQKLNEVYGMLKLLPAFPDLDDVASTSAAGTCDKEPSSSPSPFMDEDHYSPVMDHPEEKHSGPKKMILGMFNLFATFVDHEIPLPEMMQLGARLSPLSVFSAGSSSISITAKRLSDCAADGSKSKFSHPTGKPTSEVASGSKRTWILSLEIQRASKEQEGKRSVGLEIPIKVRHSKYHGSSREVAFMNFQPNGYTYNFMQLQESDERGKGTCDMKGPSGKMKDGTLNVKVSLLGEIKRSIFSIFIIAIAAAEAASILKSILRNSNSPNASSMRLEQRTLFMLILIMLNQ
nr:hypothetical protein [Tanacetum cinerariifolium]